MTDSPQSVLERVPGWERARFSELKGGLTNRAWKVSVGDRHAVLKIDVVPRAAPYNHRLAEQVVQAMAANAALANAVLYADDTAYLTEYIEGDVWTKADLDDEENLAKLASLLRVVHSLPLTGRRFNAVAAANRYVAEIDVGASDTIQRCVNIVQTQHAPHNPCFCHNDLVAENIIATPELRLLDWEYACDNDPLFDLATVVAHHDLSERRTSFFLDRYFNGNGERWRDKLEQQVTLYNALLWLWHASRPDTDPQQLLVIAARLT